MKDLRPEDKQKLANLVSELAKANKEKEDIKKELDQLKSETESQIEDLRDSNEQLLQELANIKKKFNHSLALLKNYQEKLQLKGSPSPKPPSPFTNPITKTLPEENELYQLHSEVTKLKQVVANQEQEIVNLSKGHKSDTSIVGTASNFPYFA
jgi:DNA repair exonuclease SbcCD ATPase subunit